MESKKNQKKIVIAAVLLIIAAAVLSGVYFLLAPKARAGAKEISIEVVDDAQNAVHYTVNTDAKFLRGALEETEGLTIGGTESDYGLMVETVNGVTADHRADGAYWAFYVDGAYCNYGVDEQPIEDGQAYQIVYTVQ